MKRIPPAVTYTILRLLTFFVPLAILLLLGFNQWFSAIIAALFGFAISLIFLRRPREQVATVIHNKRSGADAAGPHETPTDEEMEDDVVEHSGELAPTDEGRPSGHVDEQQPSEQTAPTDEEQSSGQAEHSAQPTSDDNETFTAEETPTDAAASSASDDASR